MGTHLVPGARSGPGHDKLGAQPVMGARPLCCAGLQPRMLVCRDGRRSLEEAGSLFVRVSAGRNKGSGSSSR